MNDITLVAHNLRSCYNVGSLLRTCDGLGVTQLICIGTTPTPLRTNDTRLPHVAQRAHRQISKTALGAEETVQCSYYETFAEAADALRSDGRTLVALEQSNASIPLHSFTAKQSVALVVGPEVDGLSSDELRLCDEAIEIPMKGSKNSFNVSVAAAIALHHLQQR